MTKLFCRSRMTEGLVTGIEWPRPKFAMNSPKNRAASGVSRVARPMSPRLETRGSSPPPSTPVTGAVTLPIQPATFSGGKRTE